MKEVTIILRPKMYFKTKEALDEAGFSALSVQEVIGRGKKPVQYDFDNEVVAHRLVAKRMITMFVRDGDVVNRAAALEQTHSQFAARNQNAVCI